jgi:hypothetical protein
MTEQPFSELTSLGWMIASDPSGNLTAVNDAAAPQSPTSVMQVRYPAGFTGGSAPGTLYYAHGATKEVYAGFYWKPSSSWQNHPSNVNKIAFWQSAGSGNNAYLMMYGSAPYHLDAAIAYPTVTHMQANVNRTVVTLGQWHRIEWHLKYATSRTEGGGEDARRDERSHARNGERGQTEEGSHTCAREGALPDPRASLVIDWATFDLDVIGTSGDDGHLVLGDTATSKLGYRALGLRAIVEDRSDTCHGCILHERVFPTRPGAESELIAANPLW